MPLDAPVTTANGLEYVVSILLLLSSIHKREFGIGEAGKSEAGHALSSQLESSRQRTDRVLGADTAGHRRKIRGRGHDSRHSRPQSSPSQCRPAADRSASL